MQLNERQDTVLRTIAERQDGLSRSELDGRVVRALISRGLAIGRGEQVHATAAGIAYIGGEIHPASAPRISQPIELPGAPDPLRDPVLNPTERIRRLKAVYETVGGRGSTSTDSPAYALNVAYLVADVLQSDGSGPALCGPEMWREFLRVTNYWEQKEAQQIAREHPRGPPPTEGAGDRASGQAANRTGRTAPPRGTRSGAPHPRRGKAPRRDGSRNGPKR